MVSSMLRSSLPLLALALCSTTAVAQVVVGVPNTDPATGDCTLVPFGSDGSAFTDVRYQVVVRRSSLGGLSFSALTRLDFAPCSASNRTYASIQVRAALLPAGTALSETFDANLGSDPITLWQGENVQWNNGNPDTWLALPLDSALFYDAASDIVIDVITAGGAGTGPALGFHRGQSIERLVAIYDGVDVPQVVDIHDLGGLKMRLTFTPDGVENRIELSPCPSQSGIEPRLVLDFPVNEPRVVNSLQIRAEDVPSGTAGVFGLGLNRAQVPLPFASGCIALHDFLVTVPVVAAIDDAFSLSFPLPNNPAITGTDVLSQYLALDTSMGTLGLATTARGSTRFQF